jgi:hypothetical protein
MDHAQRVFAAGALDVDHSSMGSKSDSEQ